MTIYAKFEKFNISYDEILKKWFITSKTDGRPDIGGFDYPALAIDFANNRVS
jgi:hypothetical protein